MPEMLSSPATSLFSWSPYFHSSPGAIVLLDPTEKQGGHGFTSPFFPQRQTRALKSEWVVLGPKQRERVLQKAGLMGEVTAA